MTEDYYKVRQVLQSASGITKCDRLLLQSASGITKCDSYYKVRRNKPDFCISFQHLWIPNSMCNIPPLPTKKKSQRVNSKKNSSSETDKQPGTPDFIGSVADVAVKTNKERKKQKKTK